MPAGSPEYHLLTKRVAVARLRLGTIVDNLESLVRVNAGEEPDIDERRIDEFHDENVEIKKERARAAGAGVSVRAAALEGVGGDASIDSENSDTTSFTVPRLRTIQFDPELIDYETAIRSEKTQKFLQRTKYGPVYIVTGLKLGTKASAESTRTRKQDVRIELGVNFETAVSLGPKFEASQMVTIAQKEEELTESILAIRVRKLRYKKTGFLGLVGPRAVKDSLSNRGAELSGDNRQSPLGQSGTSFQVIEEEHNEVSQQSWERFSGAGETWLIPRSMKA